MTRRVKRAAGTCHTRHRSPLLSSNNTPTSLPQQIPRPLRIIPPVLRFEDHTPGLQTLARVIDPAGNLDAGAGVAVTQDVPFQDGAVRIKKGPSGETTTGYRTSSAPSNRQAIIHRPILHNATALIKEFKSPTLL